ncbi:CHAT domain-containing protein, partial [Aquimarina pacifica]|uniref:CHAT domain-containing protein n=1 Tax=Aquimarina pacifica TaxID=1296415 RepID=UPI0004711173
TKNDTLVAWQHYQKADSLSEANNHDGSIILFKKALPIYEKAEAWERIASCYNKISEHQWKTKELEKSFKNANKALKISNTYLKKDHPEEANSYDNLGKYYHEKGIFKHVLVNLEKALTIRKKLFPENHLTIAKSYAFIGLFYEKTEKYQKAISYYKKTLTINIAVLGPEHKNTGYLYNNLGNIYMALQEYDKALSFQEKCLSIRIKSFGKNHLRAAISYLNIGIIYAKTLQFDIALEYYQKALIIFTKENHSYGLSLLYNNMGVIFKHKGEYNKAQQFYKKTLDLRLKVFGIDHYMIARTYMNIGTVYQKLDLEKSISYYNEALRIYTKAFGKNYSSSARIYDNLGTVFRSQKKYDAAINHYYKSIEIKSSIFGDNYSEIADSYNNIGLTYYKNNSFSEALNYYNKSIKTLKKSNKHYLISDSYNNIGKVYYQQQEYLSALSYYDKAIESNIKKNDTTLIRTFNPKDFYDLNILFATLTAKAKTFQQQYKKNKSISDLEQSTILYQQLDLLSDYLRQSYQNYEDKINLAIQSKEMYSDAIAVHLINYNLTNDNNELERVLYYIEKSKSNILKDILLDTNAKKISGLPNKIITLEKKLKSSRSYYQSQITSEQSKDSSDSILIQEYENKLFDISRQQDSLVQILEKNHPKYYQLKHQNKTISVSEIQQKLDKKTTLLEFFTSDSITYAFTISKNKLSVKSIQTSLLEENITSFRKAILSKSIKNLKNKGHELYNQLLEPIKANIVGDKLIIIPDGPLWHLNFDLLLTKNSTTNNPKLLPYLFKDYAISYGNSSDLLLNPLQQKRNKEKQDNCLAFSFSDTTNTFVTNTMRLAALRDIGDDLPGTRKEIKAIADIIDGQYYFGAQANEATFKKNANQYKILHLAVHGEVDDERPQNSKLFFT